MDKIVTLTILTVVFLASIFFTVLLAKGSDEEPRDRRFEILMDGDPVGYDEVTFEQFADTLLVKRSIKIDVSYLMINVYSYRHQDTEIWSDSRLISLDTHTNDNGTKYNVRARRTDTGLKVMGSDSTFYIRGRVVPTSYWNRQLVQQSQLLDTQHGRLLDISVNPKTREKIQVPENPIKAKKYHIRGDLNLSVWYDAKDRWAGLRFTRKGSNFTYRLVDSS